MPKRTVDFLSLGTRYRAYELISENLSHFSRSAPHLFAPLQLSTSCRPREESAKNTNLYARPPYARVPLFVEKGIGGGGEVWDEKAEIILNVSGDRMGKRKTVKETAKKILPRLLLGEKIIMHGCPRRG